ncbi:inositol monophosphatase family protein [Streptomyces spectabilis]|uniref:Inositol-1-monophosphatase n=1 Tax=Streptomyces spectabilis TaxID=68270 RepID=A0A7W8B2U3_STRST|nr:inositol monophosphatase [Streptomyces spectabilis]MBB5108962.1 myo-inositol-1(or 4)-monophosphatase [Streptomyces spectabilis]GGV50394.1 inositol monophosphatase [Streptomyces spectabilis]
MNLDLPSLLDLARSVADQAEQQLRTLAPGQITAKGDRGMVTDVDLAIERQARETLLHQAPGIGFFGEEEGGSTDAETYWIIDPVDGTANFIRDLPLCGISLALVHHGVPVLGVIRLPLLNRAYWAADNLGAWRDGRRIRASDATTLPEAMIAIGDYGTGPDGPERNRVALSIQAHLAEQAQRVRMFGSAAVDLALVADGSIDACITLGNHDWDMAAGTVIAREAGAVVMDTDGSPHTPASVTTIATAPGLRDAVLGILRTTTTGTRYMTGARQSEAAMRRVLSPEPADTA